MTSIIRSAGGEGQISPIQARELVKVIDQLAVCLYRALDSCGLSTAERRTHDLANALNPAGTRAYPGPVLAFRPEGTLRAYWECLVYTVWGELLLTKVECPSASLGIVMEEIRQLGVLTLHYPEPDREELYLVDCVGNYDLLLRGLACTGCSLGHSDDPRTLEQLAQEWRSLWMYH